MAVSKTRRILAVAGVISVAVSVAACGGSSKGSTPGNNITAGSSSPTSAAPAAKTGGKVRIAETPGASPDAIWPFMPANKLSTVNAGEFQLFFYRPLYFAGLNDKIEIDDDLSVANKPTWSSDGKTVTIQLKNWNWSDGTPVSGQDVEFWINMSKAEKDKDGYYTSPMTIAGNTVNYFPDDVASTQVSDKSIAITFDQAYNQNWVVQNVLTTLTPMPKGWDVTDDKGTAGKCYADAFDAASLKADCDPTFAYMSKASLDRKTYASNPVWQIVDGPYKLKDFNATSGAFSIVPNDKYSGTHKSYLDEIDFAAYTSSAAEYADLQAGSSGGNALQIGYLPKAHAPQYNKSDLQAGNPLAGQGYYIAPLTYLDSLGYYQLNFKSTKHGKLFSQPYFVKALQDTYDQKGAIDGPLKGWGYPTDGAVPETPAGNPVSPNAAAHSIKFDLAEAKQLMTSHGWDMSTTPATCKTAGTGDSACGDGIAAGDKAEFSLDYPSGSSVLPTITAGYKKALASAGIAVTLTEKDQNTLGNEAVTCDAKTPGSCDWDAVYYGGWVFQPQIYPSGDPLFATGSGANVWSYSDTQLDKLIAKTITSSDVNDMYAYEDYINSHQPVVYNENSVAIYEVSKGLYMPAQDPFQGYEPEFWYYTK